MGSIELGKCRTQVADDLLFLFFENRSLAREPQLGVADSRVSASIADGRLHLDTDRPFLEITSG
jgi:hypothetical protein